MSTKKKSNNNNSIINFILYFLGFHNYYKKKKKTRQIVLNCHASKCSCVIVTHVKMSESRHCLTPK